MTLCHRLSTSRRFELSWFLHIQSQAVILGLLDPKDESTVIPRNLGNYSPVIPHIPEDLHSGRSAKRTSNLCCIMLTGDLCKVSYCRHWDSAHWRHRVLAPQTGRAMATQRHHGMTGKKELPHRTTTGLFRSSQWGSATIPYKGAKVNVPVLSGNKKVSFVAASSPELLPCNKVVIQMPIPLNCLSIGHVVQLNIHILQASLFENRTYLCSTCFSFQQVFIPYIPHICYDVHYCFCVLPCTCNNL